VLAVAVVVRFSIAVGVTGSLLFNVLAGELFGTHFVGVRGLERDLL